MATQADWTQYKFEDGVLTLSLTPPAAVGGVSLRYFETKRFGGVSGTIVKSMASGFYGVSVSGMDIVNSGVGIIKVQVNSADTSGLDPGAYAFTIERLDSGLRTVVAEGYRLQYPGSSV